MEIYYAILKFLILIKNSPNKRELLEKLIGDLTSKLESGELSKDDHNNVLTIRNYLYLLLEEPSINVDSIITQVGKLIEAIQIA